MAGCLRPEEPHAPLWIVPQAGIERAHETCRVDDQFWGGPRFTIISTRDEHDIILRPFPSVAAIPENPQPTIGGALYTRNALKFAIGVRILRARRRDDTRRFDGGIGMRSRARNRTRKQQRELGGQRNPARINHRSDPTYPFCGTVPRRWRRCGVAAG